MVLDRSIVASGLISSAIGLVTFIAATEKTGVTQLSLDGPGHILSLPQGNAYPTFSTLNVQTQAVLPFGERQTYATRDGAKRQSGREYMVNLGMTNATGGYTPPLGSAPSLADPTDKVTLYAGIDCKKGGGPCWALNTSVNIEPGFSALGHGAASSELDINNNDIDSGGGDGPAGMIEPGYYGLGLAGAGRFPVTAALSIGGPGPRASFHRGLVDSNNAVDGCLVCEYGNAYRVIDARGTGAFAVDASKGHYASAINVAVGQSAINASKPDGSSPLQALAIGADNSLAFGPLGVTALRFGAKDVPAAFEGSVKAKLFSEILTTPSSSSAVCEPGQFTDDANFHYVCVSPNRWKRVALSAF